LLVFDVVFDLAADVLDESVYQFVAIEFALKEGLSRLVESLLQYQTGFFLFLLSVFLLKFLDFCYGLVDEYKTLLELFHACYFLLPLGTNRSHYFRVFEKFLPTDARFVVLAEHSFDEIDQLFRAAVVWGNGQFSHFELFEVFVDGAILAALVKIWEFSFEGHAVDHYSQRKNIDF
jgi:hypothetical protein